MDTTATGTLLEDPRAHALLADARVVPGQVEECRRKLGQFIKRYLPLFYRAEHRRNALIVIQGLLSGLSRKTAEPIARQQGVPRKRIQSFVGWGKWDDQAVMRELRRHVVEVMGDPEGVLVFDPSAFPKKGAHSCGVARTWCGRLGKKENCQVGLFLAYATDHGQAPLDRQLFLPKVWVQDPARRAEGHVPAGMKYHEHWETALKMAKAHRRTIPHRWVTGDDEFGRVGAFREGLRKLREEYILDVPVSTTIRDLAVHKPLRAGSYPPKKAKTFCTVGQWAAAQDPQAWREVEVRDGHKGPLRVRAVMTKVQTRLRRRAGPEEWLIVMASPGENGNPPDLSYHIGWSRKSVSLEEWIHARSRRHQIEEMFEQGKGEAGLGQYEVRSYIGWHHHITLSLVALWFLCLERLRLGKKRRR